MSLSVVFAYSFPYSSPFISLFPFSWSLRLNRSRANIPSIPAPFSAIRCYLISPPLSISMHPCQSNCPATVPLSGTPVLLLRHLFPHQRPSTQALPSVFATYLLKLGDLGFDAWTHFSLSPKFRRPTLDGVPFLPRSSTSLPHLPHTPALACT